MKIIHAADIHLGSPKMTVQIRNTFKKLCDYAKDNGAKVVLLSGDVFDSDSPSGNEKNEFIDCVSKYSDIDFIYLRGNHDIEFYDDKYPENVKTFGSTWSSYEYGNVVISGCEIGTDNFSDFYDGLELTPGKFNIAMLHGQIAGSVGPDQIVIKKLANKGINYLALGHVHSFQVGDIDNLGKYAYSGCLEPRGYDETGEKGVIVIDTDANTMSFVPMAEHQIYSAEVDVTGATSVFDICERVKDATKAGLRDKVLVTVTGDIEFSNPNLKSDAETILKNSYMEVNFHDHTTRKINPEDYIHDVSIKGEFVRLVLDSTELSQEMKKKILAKGLDALDGREI